MPVDDDPEYENYLKNQCEPLIEPDLSVNFSYRILSEKFEDDSGIRVNLLRNTTMLFWQVHNTKENTRTYYSLKYCLPMAACSKRIYERIYNLSKISIEETVQHLQDLRVRGLTDSPGLSWLNEHVNRFREDVMPVDVRYHLSIDSEGKIDISLNKPNYRPTLWYFAGGGKTSGTLLEKKVEFKSRPYFCMDGRHGNIICFCKDIYLEENAAYTTTCSFRDISYWGLTLLPNKLLQH